MPIMYEHGRAQPPYDSFLANGTQNRAKPKTSFSAWENTSRTENARRGQYVIVFDI